MEVLDFTPEMVTCPTALTPPSAQASAREVQAPFLLRNPHYSWPRLCTPGLVLYATQQSSDRMRKREVCDGVAPTRSGTWREDGQAEGYWVARDCRLLARGCAAWKGRD